MNTKLIEAARLEKSLNDAKRDERHWNLAETRFWLDQYKLIAEQAITALRAALEQPAQEPLTDEQLPAMWKEAVRKAALPPNKSALIHYKEAIEAAHGIGEKNLDVPKN